MTEDSTQAAPTPMDEMVEAQNRLAAAKAKLAEGERLKLAALQAKVAAIQAEKDKQAAEARAKQETIERQWRERRALEREVEDRLKREEQERNAALQREIAKVEAAQQEQRRREEALQKVAAEAQAIEQQAAQAQREALAALDYIETGIVKDFAPSAEEDASAARHPLGRFFQREELVVPEQDGISSVELSLQQQKIDALINAQEAGIAPPVFSTPQPVEEPVAPLPVSDAWRPVPRKQRFADSSASFTFETVLRKGTGIQVNPQKADALTATWDISDVLKATDIVIAEFKRKPFGCDAALYRIESILENPPQPEVEVITPEDEAFFSQVKKYSVRADTTQISEVSSGNQTTE